MLGEILRKGRINAKLSQEKLAEKAGVHRNFISLLERNLRQPTLDTFMRICKAMGLKSTRIVAKLEKEVKLPEELENEEADSPG